MPKYSVVIPIYNEEEILPELYARLEKVMAGLSETYEIVFVSDGSKDRSMDLLKGFAARNKSVKILEFSRNFGLQPAYSAGIDHASGEAVVLMDGDLQDPPELIPKLLEKWKEGYDVVYTVKTRRKEDAFKRFLFASFYRVLKLISSVDMPLDAGSFSVVSRRVADIFKSLSEKNRLISGIRAWAGFKQIGIPYERDARFIGPPRQSFRRLFRMALDGLFSFSIIPIRASCYLGLLVAGVSLLSLLAVLGLDLFSLTFKPSGLCYIANLVLFMGGVQLVFLGVLGEYVYRIYDEVKNRPMYVIKEKTGFPA